MLAHPRRHFDPESEGGVQVLDFQAGLPGVLLRHLSGTKFLMLAFRKLDLDIEELIEYN